MPFFTYKTDTIRQHINHKQSDHKPQGSQHQLTTIKQKDMKYAGQKTRKRILIFKYSYGIKEVM